MTHPDAALRILRVLEKVVVLMIAALLLDASAAAAPVVTELTGGSGAKVACWLESSLKRVYPQTQPGDRASLALVTPRAAKLSFQACYRNNHTAEITAACSVSAPKGISVQVRRVGYVPQPAATPDVPPEHLEGAQFVPGLVPDPLYPEHGAQTAAQTTQSFWITVRIPEGAAPGKLALKVKLDFEGASVSLPVTLDVRPLVLKPRAKFPVTHWWNADGIYDYYKVPAFGDQWFKLAEAYLKNMVDHGSNVIFVPLFHHRREVVQRPAQLLIVNKKADGSYEFDWSRVKRFVDLAKKCGFEEFEWPHFWHMNIVPPLTITSCSEPQRIYTRVDGKMELIIPADYPATGERYVEFLKQFLPEFHSFLVREKLLDISYFHVSDEPEAKEQDLANFKAAHDLLSQLAPWTRGRVLDALSDITYGRRKLVDIPVPHVQAAPQFLAEGIPHWVYYCVMPRGTCLNRFLDTPLAKLRMAGFLYHHLEAQGFLHWGYNFWYQMDLGWNPKPQDMLDPFTNPGGPPGDFFVVYPGKDGPIDSIRWEVFAESLQDYALLQTLGIRRDSVIFEGLNSYCDFPWSEEWICGTISHLLGR